MAVYSSKVMNESAAVIAEAVNPLQYAIDIQRDDLQLFNAVIEADFAEVYSEAGLTTLTESDITSLLEAEGNKFKQKIDEVIEKAKVVINNLITKFIATVDSLFKNDEKLVEKYAKVVSKDNCSGCTVKQETIDEEAFNEFTANLRSLVYAAKADTSAETTDLEKVVSEKASKIMKSSENGLGAAVNYDAMVKSMNGAGKTVKEKAMKFKADMESAMAKAKNEAKAKLGSAETKEGNAELNELYKSVVRVSNLVNKACTLYVKFAGKRVAVYRKNYITLGAWAMRNEGKAAAEEAPKADTKPVEKVEGEVVDKDGNPVGEATIDEIQAALLEMASDDYTNELFSLAF